MHIPKELGTYKFKRSTKRYHVYSRTVEETGQEESQYVNKKIFGDEDPPEKIIVMVRW